MTLAEDKRVQCAEGDQILRTFSRSEVFESLLPLADSEAACS